MNYMHFRANGLTQEALANSNNCNNCDLDLQTQDDSDLDAFLDDFYAMRDEDESDRETITTKCTDPAAIRIVAATNNVIRKIKSKYIKTRLRLSRQYAQLRRCCSVSELKRRSATSSSASASGASSVYAPPNVCARADAATVSVDNDLPGFLLLHGDTLISDLPAPPPAAPPKRRQSSEGGAGAGAGGGRSRWDMPHARHPPAPVPAPARKVDSLAAQAEQRATPVQATRADLSQRDAKQLRLLELQVRAT